MHPRPLTSETVVVVPELGLHGPAKYKTATVTNCTEPDFNKQLTFFFGKKKRSMAIKINRTVKQENSH